MRSVKIPVYFPVLTAVVVPCELLPDAVVPPEDVLPPEEDEPPDVPLPEEELPEPVFPDPDPLDDEPPDVPLEAEPLPEFPVLSEDELLLSDRSLFVFSLLFGAADSAGFGVCTADV